jgi:RimJ/RimL family protein N-acetyltransferase
MSGLGPDPNSTNTFRLDTERLIIAVPIEDDAPSLYDLVGGQDRVEMTAGLIWDGPDQIGDTLEFIRKAQTDRFGDGGFHWAIHDRDGSVSGTAGKAIGMIGARPSAQPGRGDVGYWLGKPYWGRGLMKEALTAVLDLSFGDLDHEKMEAEVFTGNERSIRLVESVGMRREGTIRSGHHKRGRWVDTHIYGILRDEWRARRALMSS